VRSGRYRRRCGVRRDRAGTADPGASVSGRCLQRPGRRRGHRRAPRGRGSARYRELAGDEAMVSTPHASAPAAQAPPRAAHGWLAASLAAQLVDLCPRESTHPTPRVVPLPGSPLVQPRTKQRQAIWGRAGALDRVAARRRGHAGDREPDALERRAGAPRVKR